MTIQEHISKGNLGDAIKMLLDADVDGAVLVSARYTRLKKENNQGLITSNEYSIEFNKIGKSILNLAKELPTNPPPQYVPPQQVMVWDFNEQALLDIVVENKRRRSAIANEAQAILTEYRAWKDERAASPAFDIVGRRFKMIQEKASKLVERLAAEKEGSLEKIVERITKLLAAPVPEYKDLKKAYTLASGRGFRSTFIEKQLEAMPKDDEVRIDIAEKIEAFTANIHVV